MNQRDPRLHDEKFLAFLRTLPCVVCRERTETEEACHIRMGDPAIGKFTCTGMQQKPHDFFALPLCGQHHRDQHAMKEQQFWDDAGIDPIKKALALYAVRGDHAAGTRIILAR